MKTITFTLNGSDYHVSIYEKGDFVWVVSDEGEIIQCKVLSQEWWDSNPYHPVYYNLTTLDGKVIGYSGSGNWNFSGVFSSYADAEKYKNFWAKD